MGFLKSIFGGKKKPESGSQKGLQLRPVALENDALSEGAAALIAQALRVIQEHVTIRTDGIEVAGSGTEGRVMLAARSLEEALKLHPENALLHYAYASALDIAAQGKSAMEEMKRLVDSKSDFQLAKFALSAGARRYPLFTLPQWSPNCRHVHPVISRFVKSGVLVAVRDGISPRAALFLRDARGEFTDLQALASAKIEMTTMISPVTEPQVVVLYAAIWDNPDNAFGVEAFDLPLKPAGSKDREVYQYLCLQRDIDFAVIDGNDRILLNKRLSIPPAMQQTNQRILRMLIDNPDGPKIADTDVINVLNEHKRRVPLSAVRLEATNLIQTAPASEVASSGDDKPPATTVTRLSINCDFPLELTKERTREQIMELIKATANSMWNAITKKLGNIVSEAKTSGVAQPTAASVILEMNVPSAEAIRVQREIRSLWQGLIDIIKREGADHFLQEYRAGVSANWLDPQFQQWCRQQAKSDLSHEDEEMAMRLAAIYKDYSKFSDSMSEEAKAQCKRFTAEAAAIGQQLCQNGGAKRMLLIALRAEVHGARVRSIELFWDGICGWQW